MIKKLLISTAVSAALVGIPVSHLFAENNKIFMLSTGVTLTNTQVQQNVIDDFTKPRKEIIDFTEPNKMMVQNKQPLPPVGLPKQFIIPKLNINTIVEHIGLTKDGAVGAPESARTVSWFTQGPRPGQVGNAVISGHSGIWGNGTHSIFDNLPSLKMGDTIKITDDKGIERTFRVVRTKIYGKDDIVPEIFATADTAKVNIITCYGKWLPSHKTYSQRLVVFTQLVA